MKMPSVGLIDMKNRTRSMHTESAAHLCFLVVYLYGFDVVKIPSCHVQEHKSV